MSVSVLDETLFGCSRSTVADSLVCKGISQFFTFFVLATIFGACTVRFHWIITFLQLPKSAPHVFSIYFFFWLPLALTPPQHSQLHCCVTCTPALFLDSTVWVGCSCEMTFEKCHAVLCGDSLDTCLSTLSYLFWLPHLVHTYFLPSCMLAANLAAFRSLNWLWLTAPNLLLALLLTSHVPPS